MDTCTLVMTTLKSTEKKTKRNKGYSMKTQELVEDAAQSVEIPTYLNLFDNTQS